MHERGGGGCDIFGVCGDVKPLDLNCGLQGHENLLSDCSSVLRNDHLQYYLGISDKRQLVIVEVYKPKFKKNNKLYLFFLTVI